MGMGQKAGTDGNRGILSVKSVKSVVEFAALRLRSAVPWRKSGTAGPGGEFPVCRLADPARLPPAIKIFKIFMFLYQYQGPFPAAPVCAISNTIILGTDPFMNYVLHQG